MANAEELARKLLDASQKAQNGLSSKKVVVPLPGDLRERIDLFPLQVSKTTKNGQSTREAREPEKVVELVRLGLELVEEVQKKPKPSPAAK